MNIFSNCVTTQVPCCVVVAWIMGINMDLNFNLIETVSLALAVITTAFALQVTFTSIIQNITSY